jgi:predicted dehydrogenase
MSEREAVRVAIIGCGQIGARWDQPGSAHALTHAAAFTRHPGSRVVAFCDADASRAQQAVARWGGGQAFSEARTMFETQDIDVAVVASASVARAAAITPALAAGVKLLVIEKPLATTLAESRQLAAAIAETRTPTLVNYSRHWDPAMQQIRDRLASGEWGTVQRLVGHYGKGLSNNGSHLIDLAGLLCDAQPLRARALGSPLPLSESAWSEGADPALDAQVIFRDDRGREVQLDMLGTDQSAFTCFELRIVARDALCEIALGGRRITCTAIADDPNFAGYRIPGVPAALPARYLEAMDRMADEAVGVARGCVARARCDVAQALRTATTVAAIQRSAREHGRWVEVGDATANPNRNERQTTSRSNGHG